VAQMRNLVVLRIHQIHMHLDLLDPDPDRSLK
jgi:hypothetical protein